jgi:hypothetical protein|tara:strand:+ start:335 stop:517 length:183 start_codon:yes stop_codon:yes gene_type:complete
MAEIIRHISGMCGEHFHPNIWHLLLGGAGITTILSYIGIYLKCKFKAFAYTLSNTWQKLN